MIEILYSCSDYAVVVKPYGVLSEEKGEQSCPSLIKEALGCEAVYPVHRLDRTTEGVMVYALNKKSAAAFSKMIAEGELTKEYTAFVSLPDGFEDEGEMRDYLFHDRRRDKTFVVSNKRDGVKEAVLSYRVTDRFTYKNTPCAAVSVRLETGRTHQIRAQFAARHAPLIGDGKYGSRINHTGASLYSVRLSFPWRGETVTYVREVDISSL